MREMVQDQAWSGDLSGARKTVLLVDDEPMGHLLKSEVSRGIRTSEMHGLQAQYGVKTSDWLARLDDDNPWAFRQGETALGSAAFLDLPGHLAATAAQRGGRLETMLGTPQATIQFEKLSDLAESLVSAHKAIGRMVRQAAAPRGA